MATPQRPGNTHRATQGFVSTLTWTWRRPSLTLIEIAWRWAFGIPAAWLLYRALSGVLQTIPWQSTGVLAVTVNQLLTDPLRASASLAAFSGMVLPGLLHAAVWLAPVLLVLWVALSSVGRALLLLRMDREMNAGLQGRFGVLLVLQAVRLLPLLLITLIWWFGLQALAQQTILAPIEAGGEPQMMVYVGGVIVLSLGLFLLAGGIGWVFTAAPLLALRNGTGVIASLADTVRLRSLRAAMLEINLVLSVVKIMLLVLAMAFSAFPLPFVTVITEQYVLFWSFLVAVWYFASSDFFHVTRLTAYLHLLQGNELTNAGVAASDEAHRNTVATERP